MTGLACITVCSLMLVAGLTVVTAQQAPPKVSLTRDADGNVHINAPVNASMFINGDRVITADAFEAYKEQLEDDIAALLNPTPTAPLALRESLCPYEYNGKRYAFVPVGLRYEDALAYAARSFCRGIHGRILLVETSSEENFLRSLPSVSALATTSGAIWLGISNLRTGAYSPDVGTGLGKVGSAVYYNFADDQPSGQSCTQLPVDGSKWTTTSCDTVLPFVIEFEQANGVGSTMTCHSPLDGSFYRTYTLDATFEDARAIASSVTCKGIPGQLAVFEDPAEEAHVRAATFGSFSSVGPWLGITDIATEGEMRFVTGPARGEKVEDVYSDWNDGEPKSDNAGTSIDCVQADVSGGWSNVACGEKRIYVIEFHPPQPQEVACPYQHDGHRYAVITDVLVSWEVAQSRSLYMRCNGLIGHLLMLDSVEEEQAVIAFDAVQTANVQSFLAVSDWWKEGTYFITSGPSAGSELNYTNWGENQPNSGFREDCIRMSTTFEAGWQDIRCDTKEQYYVVEFEEELLPEPVECPYSHAGHQYTVVEDAAPYAVALARAGNMVCGGKTGHLLVLNDAAEETAVLAFSDYEDFVTNGGNTGTWLAVQESPTDKEYLITAGPNTGTNIDTVYRKWRSPQPTGNPCVHLQSSGGSWMDSSCFASYMYVVEFE